MSNTAQWFVMCDLQGNLVADLKLTDPPQMRGKSKDLREGVAAVLQALTRKDLVRHAGSSCPAASSQEEATNKQTNEDTSMKNTHLMNEETGDGSTNGGGADPAAPTPAPESPAPASPETPAAAEVPEEAGASA